MQTGNSIDELMWRSTRRRIARVLAESVATGVHILAADRRRKKEESTSYVPRPLKNGAHAWRNRPRH